MGEEGARDFFKLCAEDARDRYDLTFEQGLRLQYAFETNEKE